MTADMNMTVWAQKKWAPLALRLRRFWQGECTWFVGVANNQKPEWISAIRKALPPSDHPTRPEWTVATVRRVGSHLLLEVRSNAAAQVAALSLFGILIDYSLVPALNTLSPAIAVLLLLFLLLKRERGWVEFGQQQQLARLTRRRVFIFFLLHAAIVAVCRWMIPQSMFGGPGHFFPSIGASASKYVVLAPAAVLLSGTEWRRFDKVFRAQWVAAAIALITFYPYRIFASIWPWYSQDLAQAAYLLARPFIPGLHLVLQATPVIQGPALDVEILFACSGISAVKLFQVVFAAILAIDWPDLNPRRVFIGYFTGLAVMLLANVLRISLLVISGNAGMRQFDVRHHLTAGWIFFAVVMAGWLLCSLSWLKGSRAPGSASVRHCRQEIA